MFGTSSRFEKSLNGVKTLTDGIITIKNGDIINANNITGDNITGTTITGDNIVEIENDISNNSNLINEINTVKIPSLQSQINNNNSLIFDISNNKIPSLQSQINNNNSLIFDISNNKIPNLQSQINTVNIKVNDISNNYIKTANVGTTTTLNSNQNATVSITKTGNNATFNFGIPRGKGLTYKGVYDAIDEYYVNDIVKYNNDFYICIQDVLFIGSGTPDISEDWSLMLDDETLKGQGFLWRGNWSEDKIFNEYDICKSFGTCYICLNNNVQSTVKPDDDTINWTIFVARGDKGDKGDKGDNGNDSDFFQVLSILGGVGLIFGAVALSALTFANQFQNMKNKLGNISDELQEIGEEANDEYRIGQLEKKTKWQNADSTIQNTYFNSDVLIQNELLENKIILYKTGEITAVEVNGTDVNASNMSTSNLQSTNSTITNLTVNNTTTITNELTCNGSINFDGSSIYIGNTNPFSGISSVYLNGNVLVNGFPIGFSNGFFSQW